MFLSFLLRRHTSTPSPLSRIAKTSLSSHLSNKSFSTSTLNQQSDFSLTPEQSDIQDMALSFAKQALLPHSPQWDADHHFPVDVLKEAASLGFAGLYVRDDVGGSGLGREDAAIIFEALSYGDVPVTAYLTIHNMVAGVIDVYGSETLRQHYLPLITSMNMLASYCLTEPGSGSDAASLKTTAVKKQGGSDYVINGSKAFISGGSVSDVYLVMARTGEGHKGISAFLVDKDTPGLSFGKREHKLGWNAQPTTAVMFDNVHVPERNLVGELGQGFPIAMKALDGGRINIAACSLGGAQYALDTAREYVRNRKQFGKSVGDFQGMQFKIADAATLLQASQTMVRHAAKALDQKSPKATMLAAMAKRFATDSCFNVANDALQMLGGYGYLKEYPVERIVRDLRVHSILEGTNEIMRVIIARELEKVMVD